MSQTLKILIFAILLVANSWCQTLAALSASDGITPPGMKAGPVNGSYVLTELETMNLFTGKANFALPLLQIGGRGQAGYQMSLNVESTNWQISRFEYTDNLKAVEATWDEAPAAGLSPGFLHRRSTASVELNPNCAPYSIPVAVNATFTTFVLTRPGGGSMEFFPVSQPNPQSWALCQVLATDFTRGNTFATRDGSIATLVLNTAVLETNSNSDGYRSGGEPTGYVVFKDGVRYNISGGQVNSIVDRNGNQVSLDYYPPESTTPKSIILNQSATAQGFDANLPGSLGSSNLAALVALRVEMRLHGYTLPSAGNTSVLWSSNGSAGPMLRLQNGSLEAVLTEAGATAGCSIPLGSHTDVVVRFQRRFDRQYQLQAWDYVTNGIAAPFASAICPVGTASNIDVSGMMAIGANTSRSANSLYKGRFAYVRVYGSNTISSDQPNEIPNDALLDYAFNDVTSNYTLDHGPSHRNLTAYGSPAVEFSPGEIGVGTGLLKRVTDTLGRVTDFPLEEEPTPGTFVRKIIYQGYGGAARTIEIHSKNMESLLRSGSISTFGTLFGTSPEFIGQRDQIYNPRKIAKVKLPDNRSYDFQYNVCGEVAAVTLPTQGRLEYDWDGVPGALIGTCRGYSPDVGALQRFVTTRRMYTKTNALESSTDFQRTSVACGATCPGVNNVVVAVLNKNSGGTVLRAERHIFYDEPNRWRGALSSPGWKEGKEYRTDIVKTAPPNWADLALPADNYQSMVKTWKQYGAGGSTEPTYLAWEDRPRVTAETSTLKDAGVIISKTTSSEYDQFQNLTFAQETDWSGAILRKKDITYKTDPAYVNPPVHLRGLPVVESSKDGGGTERARTEYVYDEGALELRLGVIGVEPAFSRSERGNPTRILRSRSDTSTTVAAKQRFDSLGNVVETWDARGFVASYSTTYGYNDTFTSQTAVPPPSPPGAPDKTFGFITSVTLPVPGSVAGPFALSGSYDRFVGRLAQASDLNGIQSFYTYADALDRPKTYSKISDQMNFSYPDVFTVKTDVAQNSCGVTQQLTTSGLYDSFGRPERSQMLESGVRTIDTKTIYDGLGRAAQSYLPFRNLTGIPGAGDGEGKTVSDYDWLGRPVSIQAADGASFTRFGYRANETWSRDETGKWKRTKTDGLGRLIEVSEDALVTDSAIISGFTNSSAKNYLTTYQYDDRDNLTNVFQNGRNRAFVYNSLGWLLSVNNPESGNITYNYDDNGNLILREDGRVTGPNKTKVVTAYDRWNRVTSKTYTNQGVAVATPTVTYTYDAHSATVAGSYPKGRMTAVTVASGASTTYDQIDALGRVLKSTQTTNSVAYPFEYTYNSANKVETVKYPFSNRQVTTCYDQAGRVLAVKNGGMASADIYAQVIAGTDPETLLTVEGYDAKGGILRLALDTNKLVQRANYNLRGQMEGSGMFKISGGTAPLMRLALSYVAPAGGNNGNIFSQAINVGAPVFSATQTYTYDGLNRLEVAQEGANWKQTFGYDQWGNRWIDDTQTSNIPIQSGTPLGTAAAGTTAYLANNQLSGRTYDAAGNGSPMSGRTYQYDVENRIVSATGGTAATTESFEYDGEGRRVKRTVNGVATVFVYDAFGQLAQEYGTAGTAGRNYVFADHLGSTRMMVDGTGTVKGWWDFAPYGEEIPASVGARGGVSGFAYAGQSPSMMFTGQVRDRLADGSASGLDYFGARYLSAAQGRFTSPDQPFVDQHLLDPQSWSLYNYGRNNPLRYVDPTGQAIELIGDEDERNRALGVLAGTVGKAGKSLYINSIKDGNETRYFVGVKGDLADFAKTGDDAAGLADVIGANRVVEFGITDGALPGAGAGQAANTYAPGEIGNQNVRILVNPKLAAEFNPTGLTRQKWDGSAILRSMTPGIAAWHEMGHAWAMWQDMNARSQRIISPDLERPLGTGGAVQRANDWENRIRRNLYGPLGPNNAKRIHH